MTLIPFTVLALWNETVWKKKAKGDIFPNFGILQHDDPFKNVLIEKVIPFCLCVLLECMSFFSLCCLFVCPSVCLCCSHGAPLTVKTFPGLINAFLTNKLAKQQQHNNTFDNLSTQQTPWTPPGSTPPAQTTIRSMEVVFHHNHHCITTSTV
jgi:hypothetical protein